ncbi:hypothetical protein AB0L57_04055 [Nocardia sp. NPDC052254]
MSTASVGKWKQVFQEAGTKTLDEIPPARPGRRARRDSGGCGWKIGS